MKWDLVLIALIGAIPPTILALASLLASLGNRTRLKELHIAINGRLSQLLEMTASASHNEGVITGRRYTDRIGNEGKKS